MSTPMLRSLSSSGGRNVTSDSNSAALLIDLTEDLLSALNRLAVCERLHRAEIRRLHDDPNDWVLDPVGVGTESDRQQLSRLANDIKHVIAQLEMFRPKTRLVRTHELPPDISLPSILTGAYELLWYQAYGTGSPSIGDPNSIHGTGKAKRGRTQSDQVETRGGAVQKKKLANSQKDIIKSQRAFSAKTKFDKRLRKLGHEIEVFLNEEKDRTHDWVMKCSKCKKMGEDEWLWCPRCGGQMTRSN